MCDGNCDFNSGNGEGNGVFKRKEYDDVNYSQTNVASVQQNSDEADLIVSTTKIPYELETPVINGLPLITGINEEKVLNAIYEQLKGE